LAKSDILPTELGKQGYIIITVNELVFMDGSDIDEIQ